MRIILRSFSLSLLLAAALTASVLVACSGAADDRPQPPATPAPAATATPVEAAPTDPDGHRIPHCLTGADSRSGAHCRAHARTDSNLDAYRLAHASADGRRDADSLTHASADSRSEAHRLARARADSHPDAHRRAHARADRDSDALPSRPHPPRQPHPPPPPRQRGPGWSAAKTSAFARSIRPRRLRLLVFGTCGARRGRPSPRKSGSTCWTWRRAQSRGGYSPRSKQPQRIDETGGFIDAGVSLSPGNRFLSFDRFEHDRVTGQTFEWDAPPLRSWGSLDDRRLLFRLADEGGDRFVITDGTLQPVAQFTIPDGQEGQLQWLNFKYRSLVVRGQERDGGLHSYLHFFDFNEEAIGTFEPSATQVLPGNAKAWSEGRYRLASLGPSIELAIAGPDSCHVMHFGWDGATLLDVSVPVVPQSTAERDCRISPDGRWMTAVTAMAAAGGASRVGAHPVAIAVSILDTTTGDEVYRVKGVEGPGWWLDDSSGVSMSTSRGTRIVTLDGQWATEAPRPASVSAKPAPAIADPTPVQKQPDYRISDKGRRVTVRDHEGNTLASLAFAEPESSDGRYWGAYGFSGSWGATRDEVRVWVSIYPPGRCGCGGDYVGPSPLAPVIESPPFEDRLQVEVVVDTCLRLRQDPSLRAAVLDLPPQRRHRGHGRLLQRLQRCVDARAHRRRPRGLGQRRLPALGIGRRAARGRAAAQF